MDVDFIAESPKILFLDKNPNGQHLTVTFVTYLSVVNSSSKKMKKLMSFVWVIVAFISYCLAEEVIRELRIQSNNDDVTVENEPLRLVGR